MAKALRIAKHAIRLSPRNSFAYNVEGSIYLLSKDYLNAENSFSKAIKLDPAYIDALYNLACVKSLQGDFASAKINLESAFQNGFMDSQQVLQDPDLIGLREQAEWKELVLKYFSTQDKLKK